jgi:predicted 3-demethylubiquinone-9 3-methyltransferase (glyoxalase superfamily)
MKKEIAKKSYAYKPAYGIVVMCQDEAEQIKLFNKLKAQGLQLKVVVV